MRLSRLATLLLGSAALYACSSEDITNPEPPPNSAVRFINAVADTGAVDIRAIDQVEFSPYANSLNFRGGTEYFMTEAKSRQFRVFPTSLNIGVTSTVLLDATVDIPANGRYTLLLVGSARGGTLRFVLISDDAAPPPAGQISVRMVNTASGAVSGYLVNVVADPLPGSATFANVGSVSASPYVSRATGAAAVRVTDQGSATVNASVAGPTGPAALAGAFPAAGVSWAGTAFSVYYFPPGVAGSPQNAVSTPGAVWFVDRNPCDAPAVAGCATVNP
ncbi:MAG: DUF4397 domain-containing protein [Gemmatimonadales bacterium]